MADPPGADRLDSGVRIPLIAWLLPAATLIFDLLPDCASVELGATHTCIDCMPYENNLPIWVARGLKVPMSVAWPGTKDYI